MPSGENGDADAGDIMVARLASDGDPARWPCCIMSCWDQAFGEGIEIDARGLNLKGAGDGPADMPGL